MITVEKAINNLREELGDRWVITDEIKVQEEVFLKSYKAFERAKGILYNSKNANFELALKELKDLPSLHDCINIKKRL